jgi:hypothetical protein
VSDAVKWHAVAVVGIAKDDNRGPELAGKLTLYPLTNRRPLLVVLVGLRA